MFQQFIFPSIRQINFGWETEIIKPENDLSRTSLCLAHLFNCVTGGRINELVCELNGYASYYGFTAFECLSYAYDQIKDRKGKMIDGVWVKQEDLQND